MARRKRKHKRHRTANGVVLDDVIFGTIVHDDVARVVAQEGMVFLHTASDNKLRSLPPGVTISFDHYDKDIGVTVREITNEIILDPGPNDYYEDDLAKDERIMPVSSVQELQELYTENKLSLVAGGFSGLSVVAAGASLAAVGWYLMKQGDFLFPEVPPLCIPVGIIIAILFGLFPTIKGVRRLNSTTLYDCRGNAINMETGKSSLNGGMFIPVN